MWALVAERGDGEVIHHPSPTRSHGGADSGASVVMRRPRAPPVSKPALTSAVTSASIRDAPTDNPRGPGSSPGPLAVGTSHRVGGGGAEDVLLGAPRVRSGSSPVRRWHRVASACARPSWPRCRPRERGGLVPRLRICAGRERDGRRCASPTSSRYCPEHADAFGASFGPRTRDHRVYASRRWRRLRRQVLDDWVRVQWLDV